MVLIIKRKRISFVKSWSVSYNYNLKEYDFMEVIMKIELEGTLIRMKPDNDREREELNQLWTIIIGCVNEGKKLVPVGEYIPGIKEVATFHIE